MYLATLAPYNRILFYMKYILLLLLFSACAPRIQYIKEHVVVRDTTIITSPVRVDTSFSVQFDTILLEKERLHAQIIRHDTTIYVYATCKGDTIFLPGAVREITKVHLPEEQNPSWWDITKVVLLALFAIWSITRLFR